MKLTEILSGLEGLKSKGNLEIDVSNVTSDSREIKKGDMFVAIKGFDTDGHNYLQSAIANGAKVIMVEDLEPVKALDLPEDVTLLLAKDTRKALAICSCNFYDNPSR